MGLLLTEGVDTNKEILARTEATLLLLYSMPRIYVAI
jgi:hypothetical protein